MNEKLNIQDLTQLLSVRENISKKEAESFLRELFATIAEGILTDPSVKVKGLGLFKVIEVCARESVNVQTGERVLIPSHKKVIFTPEQNLSKAINSPFEHLETTELDTLEAEADKTVTEVNKTNIEVNNPVLEVNKTTVKASPALEELPEPPSPDTNTSPIPAETNLLSDQANELTDRPKRSFFKIIVLTLIVLAILWGSYYLWINNPWTVDKPQEATRPHVQPTEQVEEPVAVENKEAEPVTENVVKKTVRVQEGERLTVIALREYGDKAFWVYLYLHNKASIGNPNQVAVGTSLIVPSESEYGIDKDNPQSIQKAKELAAEVLEAYK